MSILKLYAANYCLGLLYLEDKSTNPMGIYNSTRHNIQKNSILSVIIFVSFLTVLIIVIENPFTYSSIGSRRNYFKFS
jgi:hypothetical protein